MSIFEYDKELHERTLREEGYEEGLEHGILKTIRKTSAGIAMAK